MERPIVVIVLCGEESRSTFIQQRKRTREELEICAVNTETEVVLAGYLREE